jgi:hypothetical protein
MSKRSILPSSHWPSCRRHNQVCAPEFHRSVLGLSPDNLRQGGPACTTFITPFGYFCYLKMSFGLKNAGATYQWCMQFCFWETKWSVLSLICEESLTSRGLNSNPGRFSSFTFILVPCRESCLLVSWCVGSRCDMAGSDKDLGRSRKPGVEDRVVKYRSGTQCPDDREVGWRYVRSIPCTWRWGAQVS